MRASCRDSSLRARSTTARLSATSASADATSWLRLPALRSSRRASAEPRASRSLSTEKEVSPRSSRTSRSPAFTRSPSRTFTSTTRPATFGARSTVGASMRPLSRTVVPSSPFRQPATRRARAAAAARRRGAVHRVPPAGAAAGSVSWTSIWRSERSVPVARPHSTRALRRSASAAVSSEQRLGQVVLAGQDEEARAEACVEPLLLGAQLRLGGGLPGPRRGEALCGRLEGDGGVSHLDLHGLPCPKEPQLGLGPAGTGDGRVGAGGPVAERDSEREPDGRVGEAPLADRPPRSAQTAVDRVGDLGRTDGERGIDPGILLAGEPAAGIGGDQVELRAGAVAGRLVLDGEALESRRGLGHLGSGRGRRDEGRVDVGRCRRGTLRFVGRDEARRPERVGGVGEEQRLQRVLGAGGRLARGVEVTLPPFELGHRSGEVGFGERPGLDAGPDVGLLAFGKRDGRLAGLGVPPRREERPEGPLDGGDRLGRHSRERRRGARPVDACDPEALAGGVYRRGCGGEAASARGRWKSTRRGRGWRRRSSSRRAPSSS